MISFLTGLGAGVGFIAGCIIVLTVVDKISEAIQNKKDN